MTLTVITGPPGSGKSTHARQHAAPGDIIIDFDRIAAALTLPGEDEHDHPASVLPVARAAWTAAVRAAIRQHRAGQAVWIIHADPPAYARQDYHRNHARFVTLHADPAVLAARLSARGAAAWQGNYNPRW